MAAIIDYIPRVTLSNFKELIKQQSETKETLFIRFTLKDIQYTVVMSVEKQKLIFFWEHQGKRNQKEIKLQTEPSNLGNGTVWYFLCPYTGHKCRKLFLDGKTIASRYAFSHIYSIQKESRSGRFSMDSDDWNTQYEDTGNSSIEEKQPLTGIKSGRIIRNWKIQSVVG